MKKILIPKAGSYDQLHLVGAEDLSPAPNEVVVSVAGIGVNYADCLVRFGVYASAKKYVGWPITPGFEFSGHILKCGANVSNWKIGDAVFGVTRFSAYATQVCVPESQLFRAVPGADLIALGGFPVVYFTAFHALKQIVQIYPGSTVLIHSAAGGVGSALVKLAHLMGHRTVGVIGSSSKREYLQRLGCDEIIDKSSEDLWARVKEIAPMGFDAVFDANGYSTYRKSYDSLRPTGKLICYGSHSLLPRQGGRINYLAAGLGLLKTPRFNPLDMITENRTVCGFNISFLFDRTDLLNEIDTHLQEWLRQGQIQPLATTVIPFAECARAHQLIESGKSTGKIVLAVDPL